MTGPGVHPEFRNPPVIETVLGIQFSNLEKFTSLTAGLFWHRIKGEYPKSELKDPLFSELPPAAALLAMPFRSWFLSESGEYLVQLQADRILFNWRKQEGNSYPSYEETKPRFSELWAGFVDFLAQEGFGRPSVKSCEVTYVNHIEPGDQTGSLASFYRFWAGGPTDWLVESSVRGFNVVVDMPEQNGQVRINSIAAVRLADAKDVLQLTITAACQVKSQTDNDILGTLDKAHDLEIRAFVEFISEEQQASWGRTLQ